MTQSSMDLNAPLRSQGTLATRAPRQGPNLSRRGQWAGLAIALAFLVFGTVALPRYGLTIDSSALFYSGDRHLFTLLHPSVPGDLDLEGVAFPFHEPEGFHSAFQRFPDWADPLHYPVFPGLLAAVTANVFSDHLHWLNVLDGHHLGLLLLHTVGLFLFCSFACGLLGETAGICATLALALFPCAVGHAFNNAKDWPCALFYGVAVLAGGRGLIDNRPRDLLFAAVFLGVSLACKLNAVFAVATLVLFTPVAWFLCRRGQQRPVRRLALAYLASAGIVPLTFILLWPWLYHGPAHEWLGRLREYVHFMSNYGISPRATFTTFSLRALVFTSPPLVLACALFALLFGWRGPAPERARWALLVLWCAIPLARIALPHSNFYDGNRHFIEYVPALCALAGTGAIALWRRVVPHIEAQGLLRGAGSSRGAGPASQPAAAWLAGAAAVAVLLWPVIEYHPYETCYFNALTGGLGGAQRRHLYQMDHPHDERANCTEGDYWYSSLREALRLAAQQPGADGKIGLSGPWVARELAIADWTGPPPLQVVPPDEASIVYASWRNVSYRHDDLHQLERTRPVLARTERGGGLIFELFGKPFAPAAASLPPQLTR